MKKDYIPVRLEQAALDEIARVEAQWTQVWQPRLDANAGAGGDLTEREEYRLMAPYLAQVRGGRILDGGCGMGEWSVFLSHQGYDVYAVEISRQVIAQLATRFPQCHFTCGDIRHLDFADDFLDAYFSWGVFEHFEEGLGHCIAEAWRVIKPGGYLFISVPFQNWRHILRDARPLQHWDEAYDPKRGYTAPMRFYQWRLTAPELKRELAMRGFRVLHVHPIHRDEGLHRALSLDFHLTPGSYAYAMAKRLLSRVVPARWLCHMLMAVAQKTEHMPG